MAKAKGTKVTQKEKAKMWRLYQELGSYKEVAKVTKRSPDTVSKYVAQMESIVGTAQADIEAIRKSERDKAAKEALIRELLS